VLWLSAGVLFVVLVYFVVGGGNVAGRSVDVVEGLRAKRGEERCPP